MVGFIILGNVLSRIIHITVSPYHVNDLGMRGRAEWVACTASVTILSYIVANLM